ncbi:MAG: GT-D fold domain-containing glycosyltransferase [Candidatus Paceibacterota bacterium]
MSGMASRQVWKNRLLKFKDNPWAVISFFKKVFWYNFVADRYVAFYNKYTFLDYTETIQYAIDRNTSIIRFGDEFFDMLDGIGLYYGDFHQRWDKEIARKYKEIISTKNPNVLICVPHDRIRMSKGDFVRQGIPNEWHFWNKMRIFLKDYIHADKPYGILHVFQPQYNKTIDFNLIADFFAKKHIIIISAVPEKFTHIKLGKTTNWIKVPRSDAWFSYNDIKKRTLKCIEDNKYPHDDVLILGSASTASKILIYELTKEYDITGWDTGQFFDLAERHITKIWKSS